MKLFGSEDYCNLDTGTYVLGTDNKKDFLMEISKNQYNINKSEITKDDFRYKELYVIKKGDERIYVICDSIVINSQKILCACKFDDKDNIVDAVTCGADMGGEYCYELDDRLGIILRENKKYILKSTIACELERRRNEKCYMEEFGNYELHNILDAITFIKFHPINHIYGLPIELMKEASAKYINLLTRQNKDFFIFDNVKPSIEKQKLICNMIVNKYKDRFIKRCLDFDIQSFVTDFIERAKINVEVFNEDNCDS